MGPGRRLRGIRRHLVEIHILILELVVQGGGPAVHCGGLQIVSGIGFQCAHLPGDQSHTERASAWEDSPIERLFFSAADAAVSLKR